VRAEGRGENGKGEGGWRGRPLGIAGFESKAPAVYAPFGDHTRKSQGDFRWSRRRGRGPGRGRRRLRAADDAPASACAAAGAPRRPGGSEGGGRIEENHNAHAKELPIQKCSDVLMFKKKPGLSDQKLQF